MYSQHIRGVGCSIGHNARLAYQFCMTCAGEHMKKSSLQKHARVGIPALQTRLKNATHGTNLECAGAERQRIHAILVILGHYVSSLCLLLLRRITCNLLSKLLATPEYVMFKSRFGIRLHTRMRGYEPRMLLAELTNRH